MTVGDRVLEFYKELPFNTSESSESLAREIVSYNSLMAYEPLVKLLRPGVRVLEVGCGVGRVANRLAKYYGARVTALDFNPEAVRLAEKTARQLDLDVQFQVADLFAYTPEEPFDIVVSLGVLHHTEDCHGAVRKLNRDCLRPGGHLFIGLYHSHGRIPFLRHFEVLRKQGQTEDQLLQEYGRLHKALRNDPVMLRSWFRDQVCHPHETQHTQKEMTELLAEEGTSIISSSINGFKPFKNAAELDALEPPYADLSRKRLEQGEYFPGFFVFLARKS